MKKENDRNPNEHGSPKHRPGIASGRICPGAPVKRRPRRPPSPDNIDNNNNRRLNDGGDHHWVLGDPREVYGNPSSVMARAALIRPRRLFQHSDDDDGRGGDTGGGIDHRHPNDDQPLHHSTSGPTLILPETPERRVGPHRQDERNVHQSPSGMNLDNDDVSYNDASIDRDHAASPSTPSTF